MKEIELISDTYPDDWTDADETAFQQWLKDNPTEAANRSRVRVQIQRYNRNPILGLLR